MQTECNAEEKTLHYAEREKRGKNLTPEADLIHFAQRSLSAARKLAFVTETRLRVAMKEEEQTTNKCITAKREKSSPGDNYFSLCVELACA